MRRMARSHRDGVTDVNRRQAEFYDSRPRLGPIGRAWVRLRNGAVRDLRLLADIAPDADALHRRWLGDLSEARVLDLGCHSGNRLSLELARAAAEYVAIDLSRTGLEKLQEKLRVEGLSGSGRAASLPGRFGVGAAPFRGAQARRSRHQL